MRRPAALIAALALLALAAGCGGAGDSSTTAAPEPTEGQATTEQATTGDAGATTAAAAACTESSFTSQGQEHVEEPPAASEYNSTPPTSGPHYELPAGWGVYDEEIPQFVLVHNLEHGGIVVQYGDGIPAETVGALVQWTETDPRGILVAPYPSLGSTIAVTAWTRLLSCSQFDEAAVTAFRDAHRFHGPELLPEDTYEPGA